MDSARDMWSSDVVADIASRRDRKRARRVSEIMRTTALVLSERGYHGTSLDEVAERLDMAKASLYHYFKSKDEVIYECMAICARYVSNRLRTIAHEPDPPAERLRRLILEQLRITTIEHPETARLFLYPLDWEPAFKARVRRWQEEHDEIFAGVIEEGIARGELSVTDSVAARMCLHGALNQAPRWVRKRTAEAALPQIADCVMHMFLVSPEAGDGETPGPSA